VLYSGLVFDGTLMKPVMFTGHKVPIWHNANGLLHYVKDLKGPSTYSTLVWLDDSQDELADEPLLVWDHLGGHKAAPVQDWLEDHNVASLLLPAQTSGIMDPCDNSWHSALKAAIRRKPHANFSELLDVIVDSYLQPSEVEVSNHIRHCGYNSFEDPESVVNRLFSEGFYASSTADPRAEQMVKAYNAFTEQLRVLRDGVGDFVGPLQLKDCNLDGVYWHTYQPKNRT
jgi:hypothetical protein